MKPLDNNLKQPLSKSQRTLHRILDAGLECYRKHGVQKTRLEDVAKVASVGRTTLYRYVDNRDDLLKKILLRDAAEHQSEIEIISRHASTFSNSIVDTVVHVMRGRKDRPINKILFNEEKTIGEHASLSPQTFLPMVEELLAKRFYLAQQQGEIRSGISLAQTSEWLTRIILSLVAYPGHFLDDEDALRQYLRQFVLPPIIETMN